MNALGTSLALIAALAIFVACASNATPAGEKSYPGHAHPHTEIPVGDTVKLTDDEWKKKLTPEQYHVLREAGTERAWTGALLDNKKEGTYRCAACGAPLFESDTKYNSGSGWPSFYTALDGRVDEKVDHTHGMVRTEVLCARCGGHLGHKFPDGPQPTGERYCINSVSLEFEAEGAAAKVEPAAQPAAQPGAQPGAKGQGE